ncbi:chloride channel protein [Dickeya oryzae]|uniref:chloride channel protein n=1 Tax=Dickeya oryzae TaxID=1240404 RepID=UPI001AECFB16|nr:chloride channel protein [Dickeya oryzae]MBP2846844.1 chloride channel protein [Dickeya oryzae]
MSEIMSEKVSGSLSQRFRFVIALLLTGVLSGFGGMLLALLLHTIQHLAYGYSVDHIISEESFLQGVSAAEPTRRFLVLLAGGLVAGLGWYTLYRYGRRLVNINVALQADKPDMPTKETIIHTLLQITTVALGSPLGRESLLTPGLANGALLAVALGGIWSWFFADNQPGAYAVIGAAAFLATSMKMPLTSLVLIMELTHISDDFFAPMALCITGAVGTSMLIENMTADKK